MIISKILVGPILKVGSAILFLFALYGCNSMPTRFMGGEWLMGEKLRTQFADQTVIARNVKSGTLSTSYYSVDGTIVQIRHKSRRTGTWQVTSRGKMCIDMKGAQRSCRIVVKGDDGIVRKYKSESWGKKAQRYILTIEYVSFTPGNIKN